MPRAFASAAVIAALLFSLPAAAALAVQGSVEDLARTSDAVVRGRVLGQSSRWVGRRIMTDVRVRAADTWRGSAPREVTVTVAGGVVGDIGQRADGVASFTTGEDVVLFVARASDGTWRVNGDAQGKFTVSGAEAAPALSDVEFVAREVRPGERAAERMPVVELERRVREAR